MDAIDIALLILRLVLGAVMVAHGVKHARGRQKTSKWFGSIGFRAPQLQWFASTVTEIAVGVMLVGGLLTTAATAGVVGVMVVAYVSVHRFAGFWVTARPDEGWEYVLTLSAVAGALAITGPGAVSIDSAVGVSELLDGWVGVGAIVVGVAAAAVQLAMFYRPAAAEAPS